MEAKQILAASGKGGFTLNADGLESILLSENVRNKPVIVISVAGVFRSGKSFLLDMMLRYLKASDKSNWMDEPSARGFPWQSGRQRHTDGILIYPEPFPVTLPTGEEAAIVLMDTQGTFDNQTTVHESSTVFALSMLLSSLQIFNIKEQMQNDHLEHLQLFTEYGRMAVDQDTSTKPFQKLLFLVRDWQLVHELPLGTKGGDTLVTEWLQIQGGKKELTKVRQHIMDCFSDINGFLLPHPGKEVAGSPSFAGSSGDMEPDFIDGLKELMPKILAPENLTVKTIAGNPVRAGQLCNFLVTCTNLFHSDELPKPKTIMEATAEANNMAAVQEAIMQYAQEMECLEDQPSLAQDEFIKKHRDAASKAEKAFNDRKKMGDRETSDKYRQKLVERMEKQMKFAEQENNIKREKERQKAKEHNLELEDTCRTAYIDDMESVINTHDGAVPLEIMNDTHETAKQKALDRFDAEKKVFGDDDLESRNKLSQDVDASFHQMLFHNSVKKEEKTRKAAKANTAAVALAKAAYQSMMDAMMSTGALTAKDIEDHERTLKIAIKMFDSRKDVDDLITTGHLENMKSDMDHELLKYQRGNEVRVKPRELQAKMGKVRSEEKEANINLWKLQGRLAGSVVMKYCISDRYRPTIYQHFHQWLFLYETRHQCPRSPTGRCRVNRRGRWYAYRWWWTESGAGNHGGRQLASVQAEIHFNITSQWEVPELFV